MTSNSKSNQDSKANLKQQIIDISEQCVRCGMCIPHCPTNQLFNTEGHSPRGRIALWQSLAQDDLELTAKTYDYLSHCLSCGACENNCPAGVEFLDLQDLGKAYINQREIVQANSTHSLELNIDSESKSKNKAELSTISLLLIRIFSSKRLTSLSHIALYFYQKLRLHFLVNLLLSITSLFKFNPQNKITQFKHNINKYYSNLPKLRWPRNFNIPKISQFNPESESTTRPTVILFTGCVNQIVEEHKVLSSINILSILGFNIHIEKNLHCCGALYKHNGYLDKFEKISNNNKKVIANIKNSLEKNHPNYQNYNSALNIITLDTGCHPELLKQLTSLKNVKVSHIENFLYNYIKNNHEAIQASILERKPNQENLEKVPQNHRNNNTKIPNIYFYTPCTQREQLKTPNITKNLLQLILPKANIMQIPKGYGCCGAAGNYMIEHPNTAPKLAEKIIDDFIIKYPDALSNKSKSILCTSNIGCSMHLKNILTEKLGSDIRILTPIQIIEKFLDSFVESNIKAAHERSDESSESKS